MVDEYSRYVVVMPLRSKGDAADALLNVLTFLQTQTRLVAKEVHGDGGTEIYNAKVRAFLTSQGTTFDATPADSPALNGIAERMNRTLMEMTRAMLIQSEAHVSLWGEAIRTAAFTHNCTAKRVGDRYEAPIKTLLKVDFDVAKLRVFGCDVWRTIPINEHSKLSPRAEKAMFIGYTPSGSYRIMVPNMRLTPIQTRDVSKWDESNFTACAEITVDLDDLREHDLSRAPKSATISRPTPNREAELDELNPDPKVTFDDSPNIITETQLQPPLTESENEPETADTFDSSESDEPDYEAKYDEDHDTPDSTDDLPQQERELFPIPEAESEDDADPEYTSPDPQESEPEPSVRRSSRISRPTDRGPFIDPTTLMYNVLIAAAQISTNVMIDPVTYKQAMSRPDADKWRKARDEELDSMRKNNVYELVDRKDVPADADILGSRIVWKTKLNARNEPIRWKARLVAKGFQQREGINYDETFAPVARHKSIKLLLTLVNELNLELKQVDFITAFLNAPLDYVIYMEQPEGMETYGDGRVLKLLRAIYGLKQSPRQWNIELHNWLVQNGYNPIVQDPCIYVKPTTGGRVIVLAVYVDDTAIAYHAKDEAVWLADKRAISKRYPITDLGDCQWLLGMEIRRDREKGILTLSQLAYTERVLKQFDLLNCKGRSTPMAYNGELGPNPHDGSAAKPLNATDKKLYQSMIGSLLYAACMTRMDITFATAKLAQFCAAPAEHHLIAARQALKYLAGTRTLGLTFRRSARKLNLDPTVYPDASWISEVDSGRSHSGVITLLNGNPIHWWSKKQSMVALSSTEAEYIALGEAAKDAVWLREWLTAVLGLTVPIRVLCDNSAALKVAANDTDSARTRHYSARHHFVRELIQENQLRLEWVSTQEQAADLLTKQLTEEKLRIWRDRFLTTVTLD